MRGSCGECHEPMSIKRQFGKSVAWMAAGNWIEQAINFSVFVLLARLLGAEAFGFLAMAAAFVILCEVLVRESLTEYLISGETPRPGHMNAAFWMLLGLGAALMVILVLLAGLVADFYDQPLVATLIRLLSVTVFLVALGAVPTAILRRELRFKSLAVRAVAGVVAGGIVALWMALNGYGVLSLVAQRVVQVATNAVLAWAAVSWRPGLKVSKQESNDILGFGSAVLSLRAAEIARVQVPMVIIGATLGPTMLGLFSIAWRLVEIGSFLIMTPLRMVSQSAFAVLRRGGENAADLLTDILRISGMIAFPAFCGLAILATPVLAVLFGDKWLEAAPILAIIAIIGSYQSVELVHRSYCLAAKHAKDIAIISWVEVCLGGLLIWWASKWGIVEMSLLFVASFFSLWLARIYIVSRLSEIRIMDLLLIHRVPLIGAILMSIVVLYTAQSLGALPPVALIAGSALTGITVYVGYVYLFMRERIVLLRSFFSDRA